jgi:DNA repair protein RadA/Sms
MKGSAGSKTLSYSCRECGYRSSKWMGFCPQCRVQEALTEESVPRQRRDTAGIEVVSATADRVLATDRSAVGIEELDRVLGGGIVPGGTILVGGEPGVGKSTLLLQTADRMAGGSGVVLIATAEESIHQVQMRARRVGVRSDGVSIASVNDVDDIIDLARRLSPAAVVVDSIQTISASDVAGTAGGTTQVRESAARLINFAKRSGTPVLLVGHVTKDGSIAGPRTLEHMVDIVLYLEGDADRDLRFLRGIKNRFGSVNEVGVFEMTQAGLTEVSDPSRLLVAHRDDTASGSILFPALEGRRPLVVEIQALVVKSEAPQPRRAVTGLVPARVHQILGILERHLVLPLRQYDVYVSVMGGIRVTEPAADLPTALAIASAYTDVSLGRTAAWGELGLTGDVRSVPGPTIRRSEAQRLSAGPIVDRDSGVEGVLDAMLASGLVDLRDGGASHSD